MIFDYVTLKLIWFVLMGIIVVGFAITGGYDFGAEILLPIIGKKDEERQAIINAIGPNWEGNQVWLITLAAGLLAAWPLMYAVVFSGLYFAILLVLLALILRPPGIDYRSKIPLKTWRSFWDWSLFFSGLVPSLVFGIGVGNLFLGIPYSFDESLHAIYHGSFFELFRPYTILAGFTCLSAFTLHGALYLQLKTEPPLEQRAMAAARIAGSLFLITFGILLYTTLTRVPGMQIESMPNANESITPLIKTVQVAKGYWLSNFELYPVLWFAPLLVIVFVVIALLLSAFRQALSALFFNALSLTANVATIGFALFPFVLPSSTNPNHSLTIWDTASSHLTLTWMFWGVVIFMPIVLLYTTWAFRVMRGKVKVVQAEVTNNNANQTGY